MGEHLTQHGDGVKDVAFTVQDLDAIVERAKSKGCTIDKDIWEESDQFGKVPPSCIFCGKFWVHIVATLARAWFKRKILSWVCYFLPGFEKPMSSSKIPSNLGTKISLP
jgi:4-hydroxyphenylpyruvate dioxygenase